MTIKKNIRNIVRKFGYDITLFPLDGDPLIRRKKIIQHQKIDTILDVGANVGQYGKQLRDDIAFKGKIISFEPMNDAFQQLKINAQ